MPNSATLEILAADGVTWLPLAMRDAETYQGRPLRDEQGTIVRRHYESSVTASDADSSMAEWLEPIVQEDWSGGVGVHGATFEVVYARTPGHLLPAGAATTVTIPVGGANSPIVAFAEFGSDVFAAEEGAGGTGGRVLRLAGGTGAAWTAVLSLGLGEIIRDLCVFDNGAGAMYLYASSSSTGGLSGRLHRTNDGVIWTSTDVAGTGAGADFGVANGRNRMRAVNWTTGDGFSAWRLVSISRTNTIAYTRPDADPFAGNAAGTLSWVEGVKILTDSNLDELAAARHHVWVSSKTNVYDLNALGESPALLGYQDRTPSGIRFPVQYYNGYLYRAGASTMERIYVDGPTALLQEKPQQCAPGWGTPAENEWRGYPTAFAIDQGYLVVAIWNPSTGRTGIFWGIERTTPGVDNPLAWFGPEIVSTGARRVTALAPSMQAGDRRMWVGSLTGGGVQETIWVSLPVAGAPIQDLLSSGTHRYTTGDGSGNWQASCRILSLPETWKDKNALKILSEYGIGTRGVNNTTGATVDLYARADPDPGSTAWGASVTVTQGPTQTMIPIGTTKGHKLEYRLDLKSPHGGATPPQPAVVDAVRALAWRIVPSLLAVTLNAEYGDGVFDVEGGTNDTIHPDDITAQLKLLGESGLTTLRFPDDQRRIVKVRQVLDLKTWIVPNGTYGKRVEAKIIIADLGAA